VHTKATCNCNATSTSKNFWPAELNTCNWIVPLTQSTLHLHCNATRGNLSNLAPRQLNVPVFSRVALHTGCLVPCMCHISRVIFRFQTARNVEKATNTAFVQLTEQEPGLYDKSHPDYGRRDRVYLVWEGISCEMKDPGYAHIFWLKLIIKSQQRTG
jgi:hypothetical protein